MMMMITTTTTTTTTTIEVLFACLNCTVSMATKWASAKSVRKIYSTQNRP